MRRRNRSPCRSMISAIRSISVASRPRPMMLAPIELDMLPQPSDGFEWVQAGPAAALACRALASLAPHFFTTREWLLGSAPRSASDSAWDEVAQAAGVSRERLVRVRQVHGTHVFV